MPFLDIESKTWNIKNSKIPIIENIPMKELRWFRDKRKEAVKLQDEEKITLSEAMKFDEEWWDKTCQIGLGKTREEVEDLGVTEPEFRSLMAEIYHFLTIFGNVEEAKLSDFYVQKTKTNESKQ